MNLMSHNQPLKGNDELFASDSTPLFFFLILTDMYPAKLIKQFLYGSLSLVLFDIVTHPFISSPFRNLNLSPSLLFLLLS